MKRTILIPTDFFIESLNLLKAVVQSEEQTRVRVVFFHAMYLSDSITDLLFLSKEKLLNSIVPVNFHEAVNVIRNKFVSSIESITIELFSGNNQMAFQNFLDANKIDAVFIPKKYTLRKIDTRSFDPIPLIRKCQLYIQEVAWQETENIPEKNQLAELFYIQAEPLPLVKPSDN